MASRPNMSWTVSLATEPGYLYVVLKGRFNNAELNEMLDDVCTLKENFPRLPVLFNDLEFDVGPVQTRGVASAASYFIMKNPVLAGSKVAIVMKTEKDLEVAKRWKDMTAAKLSIFRSERNAMKWLARSV